MGKIRRRKFARQINIHDVIRAGRLAHAGYKRFSPYIKPFVKNIRKYVRGTKKKSSKGKKSFPQQFLSGVDHPHDQSRTYAIFGRKGRGLKSKFLKRNSQDCRLMLNVSGNVYQGTAGRQLVAKFYPIGDQGQLVDFFERVIRPCLRSGDGIIVDNADRHDLINNPEAAKFFLGYVSQEYKIINNSNVMAECWLYTFVCRRDSGAVTTCDPESLFKVDTQSLAADTGVGVTGYVSSWDTPGTPLTRSYAVNRFWKLKKKQKFTLGPGAQHRHVTNYRINRVISMGDINENNFISGVTVCSVLVAIGGMVHDANHSNVTTSPLNFDYIGTDRIAGHGLVKAIPQYYSYNNLADISDANIKVDLPDVDQVGQAYSAA